MLQMIGESLCLGSFVLALRNAFLIRGFLVATRLVTLRFDVVIEHIKCLVDFLPQFVVVIRPTRVSNESSDGERSRVLQGKQFRVVHLQKHASDFASKLGLHLLDLRVQRLTQKLLLLVLRRR